MAPAPSEASSPAQGSEAWPAGLAEVAGAAVAADAYAIDPGTEGGHWRAANPDQALEATFSDSGLSVTSSASAGDAWSFGLSTTGVGRVDALAPVAPAEVVAEGGTIEYRRGDLTEWYVNDARGVEQGFTLAAPPAAGQGPVVVEMGLSGDLVPRIGADARGLILSDAAGADVARYDGLVAFDATGTDLAAHMELIDGALRLVVDDAGAVYPLTIDPVINTQQAKLTAADGAAGDAFGGSVAFSGDTAVVGAPADGGGSAYVFVRSGATWSQQAKLTAFESVVGVDFGTSVAVSGDTVVVGEYDAFFFESGAAYVFVRSGDTWAQQATLNPADPIGFSNSFGTSVAVSDDTTVVGDGLNNRAYVFVRSGEIWSQQAALTASDAALGGSVSISGDTAVVGATGRRPRR